MKVGDLVKMPSSLHYWWGDQVGVIDLVEPYGSGNVKYRFRGFCGRTARFSQVNFVEVLNESREPNSTFSN